ncbi:MAG TPA: DUF11 domain-containing protein [Thermoanaerobaculia bacterium]|nr:DUF11 domain-containing protein [Thermoanaerobaculia bacterium]
MSRKQFSQVAVLVSALVLIASASFAGVVSADLWITMTDSPASPTAGGTMTFTIMAGNDGPADVTGASVTDTFPAELSCTWTCTATAGSSCTASGTGDINDSVDLLANGVATYTATCNISNGFSGAMTDTASISGPLPDPNTANNSQTANATIAPFQVIPIPAAGEAGLALLGLLLLGAAVWLLRR